MTKANQGRARSTANSAFAALERAHVLRQLDFVLNRPEIRGGCLV